MIQQVAPGTGETAASRGAGNEVPATDETVTNWNLFREAVEQTEPRRSCQGPSPDGHKEELPQSQSR